MRSSALDVRRGALLLLQLLDHLHEIIALRHVDRDKLGMPSPAWGQLLDELLELELLMAADSHDRYATVDDI
jgi:hypothetical protein